MKYFFVIRYVKLHFAVIQRDSALKCLGRTLETEACLELKLEVRQFVLKLKLNIKDSQQMKKDTMCRRQSRIINNIWVLPCFSPFQYSGLIKFHWHTAHMPIFTWEFLLLEPIRGTTWAWDLVLFPTLNRLKSWFTIAWKLPKNPDSRGNGVSASEGGSLLLNHKWKHAPESREPERWWTVHKSQYCKVLNTLVLLQ